MHVVQRPTPGDLDLKGEFGQWRRIGVFHNVTVTLYNDITVTLINAKTERGVLFFAGGGLVLRPTLPCAQFPQPGHLAWVLLLAWRFYAAQLLGHFRAHKAVVDLASAIWAFHLRNLSEPRVELQC
jgi:hypothetical protein